LKIVFNVVLIEPEISAKHGKSSAVFVSRRGQTLHLVKPLGFSLDDRQLKRAGLDYWSEIDVRIWDSFAQLQSKQASRARYFFLTTKSKRAYHDCGIQAGRFSRLWTRDQGLAGAFVGANIEDCITIPMSGTRS
jgi:tRNA (cytidine/uridine-2'-O-)-methyltransferase